MILTIVAMAIGIIAIVLAIVLVVFYNKFQVLKNGSEAGLSQIKVALKKRLDLISQLVEIVKSYAAFERGVFEKITELRSRLSETASAEHVRTIDEQSKNILDKIMVMVENYPNLKASENVTQLMSTVTDVEDEIARQRYTYNNIVQDYNTRRETFPSNMVARMFTFKKLEYLQFEDAVNTRPDGKWNS
ncbi:MAG: LemA family protein [Euryarchaeota archaeon]|nr:LemA family protein [Euryarchaeota archaeon]